MNENNQPQSQQTPSESAPKHVEPHKQRKYMEPYAGWPENNPHPLEGDDAKAFNEERKKNERKKVPSSESSHRRTEQPGDQTDIPLHQYRIVGYLKIWRVFGGYLYRDFEDDAGSNAVFVPDPAPKQAELVEENARLKAECSSHEKERYEIYSFDSSQAMEIKALQKELEQLRSERDKMREENERLKQELQDEKDYLHGIIKQTEQDAAREIDKYRP